MAKVALKSFDYKTAWMIWCAWHRKSVKINYRRRLNASTIWNVKNCTENILKLLRHNHWHKRSASHANTFMNWFKLTITWVPFLLIGLLQEIISNIQVKSWAGYWILFYNHLISPLKPYLEHKKFNAIKKLCWIFFWILLLLLIIYFC